MCVWCEERERERGCVWAERERECGERVCMGERECEEREREGGRESECGRVGEGVFVCVRVCVRCRGALAGDLYTKALSLFQAIVSKAKHENVRAVVRAGGDGVTVCKREREREGE